MSQQSPKLADHRRQRAGSIERDVVAPQSRVEALDRGWSTGLDAQQGERVPSLPAGQLTFVDRDPVAGDRQPTTQVHVDPH